MPDHFVLPSSDGLHAVGMVAGSPRLVGPARTPTTSTTRTAPSYADPAPSSIRSRRHLRKVVDEMYNPEDLLQDEGAGLPDPSPEAYSDPDVHEFGLDDTAAYLCDAMYLYFASRDTAGTSAGAERARQISPESSYYFPAFTALLSGPWAGTYQDLFHWSDTESLVTDCDLALLFWTAAGRPVEPEVIEKVSEAMACGLRVVVVKESRDVMYELREYPRSHRSWVQWREDMYEGRRGVPLPLVVALFHRHPEASVQDLLGYLITPLSVSEVNEELIRDL